jgi:hypothetical protein
MPDLDLIKQGEQGCETACALRWRTDALGHKICRAHHTSRDQERRYA